MSASAVSRALAQGGLRPLPSGTPRSREGIRVQGSFLGVSVMADFDSEATAARRSISAAEILYAAGYSTQRSSATRFTVSRKETT